MSKSLAAMFAQPPHWAVFENVLRELGDGGLNIDAVKFMEAIGKVFIPYAEATTPYLIQKKLGGKRSDLSVDYHVLCRGVTGGGRFVYRIVGVNSLGQIEMLDISRLMDDAELFGRRRMGGPVIKNLEQRFDRMLEFRPDRLRRHLGREAEWAHDLGFIEDTDIEDLHLPATGRRAVIDDMMKEVEGLIGTQYADMKKRDFIFRLIKKAMEDFDTAQAARSISALQDIKQKLDRNVIGILSANPSALTTRNYRWLTVDKRPHVLEARRSLIKECPIVLLVDDRQITTEETLAFADSDSFVTHYFGAKTAADIAFYKSLREKDLGYDNARKLPELAKYLRVLGPDYPRPASPDEWSRLALMIDASQAMSSVVDRPTENVIRDIALRGDRAAESTLARYFSQRSHGAFESIRDLKIWKNRIAASVLTPKILTEGELRGLHIPVRQAFYMVSGFDLVGREAVAAMPRKLRSAIEDFNREQSLIGVFFEGVPVGDLLDAAFDFGTHRNTWDEKLRDLMITNRLFERGAEFLLPELPIIEFPEDHYSVIPLRTQAALLKECYETGSEMWRLGPSAVKEGIHFVSVRRRGAKICATVCLREADGPMDDWGIVRIDPAMDDQSNIRFDGLVSSYLTHPTFLQFVSSDRFESVRAKLRSSLLTMAKDSELMGFKIGNPDEKAAILDALRNYVPIGDNDWRVDDHGCISTPKLNAVTATLLREISPFYRGPAVA